MTLGLSRIAFLSHSRSSKVRKMRILNRSATRAVAAQLVWVLSILPGNAQAAEDRREHRAPFAEADTAETHTSSIGQRFVLIPKGEFDMGALPLRDFLRISSEVPDEDQLDLLGLFKPNSFGLFDMHGNVLEWCEGEFSFLDPLKDLQRPRPTAGLRPLRGGNWFNDVLRAGSACRSGAEPDHRMSLIGFRIVMEND